MTEVLIRDLETEATLLLDRALKSRKEFL